MKMLRPTTIVDPLPPKPPPRPKQPEACIRKSNETYGAYCGKYSAVGSDVFCFTDAQYAKKHYTNDQASVRACPACVALVPEQEEKTL